MRPSTLAEVAVRSSTDPDWRHHLDEFLDDFYGFDGDPSPEPMPSWAASASISRDVGTCQSRAGSGPTNGTSRKRSSFPTGGLSEATCLRSAQWRFALG